METKDVYNHGKKGLDIKNTRGPWVYSISQKISLSIDPIFPRHETFFILLSYFLRLYWQPPYYFREKTSQESKTQYFSSDIFSQDFRKLRLFYQRFFSRFFFRNFSYIGSNTLPTDERVQSIKQDQNVFNFYHFLNCFKCLNSTQSLCRETTDNNLFSKRKLQISCNPNQTQLLQVPLCIVHASL